MLLLPYAFTRICPSQRQFKHSEFYRPRSIVIFLNEKLLNRFLGFAYKYIAKFVHTMMLSLSISLIDTLSFHVCVCVCVCVCCFCTITPELNIGHCQIKVKVTVGFKGFISFTAIQTVESYNSTLVQARKFLY